MTSADTPATRLTLALKKRGIKVRRLGLKDPKHDVVVGTLRARAKGQRWSVTEDCAAGNDSTEAVAEAVPPKYPAKQNNRRISPGGQE